MHFSAADRLSMRTLLAAMSCAWLCTTMMVGCDVNADIVARANDGGLGLDEDSGGGPGCEIEERPAYLSSQPNCELALPVPLPEDFDWQRLNVTVLQRNQLVQYAGGLVSIEECDQYEHGWYWIERTANPRIGFCPQTCDLIEQWETIAFQFGCETLQPWLPPRM